MNDSRDVSRNNSLDEFKETAQTILDEIKAFVLQLAQDLKNKPFTYEVAAGACRQFIREHTGSKEDHFDTLLWPKQFQESTSEQDCTKCLYALHPWERGWEPRGEDFSGSLSGLDYVFFHPLEWISWRASRALGAVLRTVPLFAMDADTSVQKQRLKEELLNHCTEVIELLDLDRGVESGNSTNSQDEPRIRVDAEAGVVYIDGRAWGLKGSDQIVQRLAEFLEVLITADGDLRSSEEHRVKTRDIETQRPAIRDLIESQPGAGCRIPRDKIWRN